MKTTVKKAVIPVAGFGTRLLPATKAQPKEMLPVVDRPVLHYLVAEAAEAGIEQILFITNSKKHGISDYFSRDLELEKYLQERGKEALIDSVRSIHEQAEFLYVHQDEPLGSGDAIMRSRGFVGEEPFAVFYADDIMVCPPGKPAIGQLMAAYDEYQAPVMGLMNVPREEVCKYGVIQGEKVAERVYKLERVVEKPKPEDAPSTLVSVGRFVLTHDIFPYIEKLEKKNGELYLTDAIDMLTHDGAMYGYEMEGTWHDCGSKLGLWKANLELGLTHPDIGKEAQEYLAQRTKK
jgi:UTP--glucose-1-phosphate uridylyltransferase